MNKFLVLSLFFFSSFGFGANIPNCTITKISSVDSLGEKVVWGNAFSFSKNYLVTNDHTVADEAGHVDVYLPGLNKPVTGKVVSRDFFTDLAVIKLVSLETSQVEPCPFDVKTKLKYLDSVTIKGKEATESDFSVFTTSVMNPNSVKMEIPGIRVSYELASSETGDTPTRSSMSGSPVFYQGAVIGMVAEKTKEQTSLVIPSTQIIENINKMISQGVSKRPFSFNRKKNIFYFAGMEFNGADQKFSQNEVQETDRAGNVHERGSESAGNPHEFSDRYGTGTGTYSVSGEIEKENYVVGHVVNLDALKKGQPDVADFVSASAAQVVLIRSVDHVPTPNLLSFIRVLGSCSRCEIDSFLVRAPNPLKLSDRNQQAFAYVYALLDSFKKTKSPEFFSEAQSLLQGYADNLKASYNSLKLTGFVDPELSLQNLAAWNRVEELLSKVIVTDEENDLVYEIRARRQLTKH